MALSAVHKVLKHGLIASSNPAAAQAMHAVADAVTLCRFEATDSDHDDVVLSKILHVLLECMRCPTGALLSDDDVCNIVQACYRIGHQSGKESALLRNLSRHILREIVHAAFGRLPHLPAEAEGTTHPHIDNAVAAPAEATPNDGTSTENGEPSESISPSSPTKGAGREDVESVSEMSLTGGGEPFGLACVLEIFRFSVSFVSLEPGADEQSESVCAFGLQLVLASLESAGYDFIRHPALLRLVKDDLSRAMLTVAPLGRAPVLAAVAATVLQLYMVMHSELKMQLEAFLRMSLLPLAEFKPPVDPNGSVGTLLNPGGSDTRRVALECLVDLCRQPNFVPDLYVNFDCDVRRPNLFEELVGLLSRGATPAQGSGLSDENLLSLEGLLAITAGVADRSASFEPSSQLDKTKSADAQMSVEDFWGTMRNSNGGVVGSDETSAPGSNRASFLRRNRYLKRRLLACAENFNLKPKKGLAYMQELGLLSDPLNPEEVAQFLKHAPGLDKSEAGEYLGDHKDFNVSVLGVYVNKFDFDGVTLDAALRSFLDGFRLPGEAQKISRFLEVFADRYFSANPTAVADADAAYVLSYSIIMLNTDQHNPQVKNKMTLEQFIRNNRGTNGGADYPRETLEAIFDEIRLNEIKLADDTTAVSAGFDSARWADMMRIAGKHKYGGRMISTPTPEEASLYDEDLFQVVWSPTVTATCSVFEFPVEESALKEALDGFLAVARIAGTQGMTDVMDQLVTTLCTYAMPAGNPSGTSASSTGTPGVKPSVLFGEDDRKRTALVTAFTVANRYGDTIRSGWCPLMDVVLKLHKLDLLSDSVRAGLDVDGNDGGPMLSLDADGTGENISFREFEKNRVSKLTRKASGGSSLLRGFSQLLSLESDAWGGSSSGTEPTLTPEEQAAEDRALRCVEACRVDDIFADAKFLGNESLGCLARALTWAAGPAGAAGARAAQSKAAQIGGATFEDVSTASNDTNGTVPQAKPLASPKGAMDASAAVAAAVADEDGAAFCLDVLVGVTLRNRDRCRLLLPHTYGYLRAVVQSAKTPTALVERAVFELLRICRQMLPDLAVDPSGANNAALADDLLDALRLTFALEPNVADALITRIAVELNRLVESAVASDKDFIRTAKGWDTVCKLLMASARHPDASKHGFQALSLIVGVTSQTNGQTPSRLVPWNVRSVLEATSAFVDAHQGGDERSIKALGLLGTASDAIGLWCGGEADGGAVAVAAVKSAGGDPKIDSLTALNFLRKDMLEGPWSDITRYLRRVAVVDERPAVRDDAVLTLQRVLLGGDGLHAPDSYWTGCFAAADGTLVPMLTELVDGFKNFPNRSDQRAGSERTAHLAVSCVAKTFLARLPNLLNANVGDEFALNWTGLLDRMAQLGKAATSEELREAVTEAAKNMLLVMSAQGVLAPGAPSGLWEETWKQAAAINPGLTPAIVGAK